MLAQLLLFEQAGGVIQTRNNDSRIYMNTRAEVSWLLPDDKPMYPGGSSRDLGSACMINTRGKAAVSRRVGGACLRSGAVALQRRDRALIACQLTIIAGTHCAPVCTRRQCTRTQYTTLEYALTNTF